MRATPCTRCRTPLPEVAQFCVACGAPAPVSAATPALVAAPGGQPGVAPASGAPPVPPVPPVPPGFVPVDQGMPVCLGCGIVAPRKGTTCPVCELDLPPGPARAAVPPEPGRRFWVAVRCQFQCRVCGHESPLNHLDMDGSVMCLRCGTSQVFEVDSWKEGLAHSHAVGDLAGPDPEGRFANRNVSIAEVNPFRHIGNRKVSASSQQSEIVIAGGAIRSRSLQVDASPGHPLCGKCRAPLTVTGVDEGALSVRCRSCGDHAEYEIPAPALSMCRGLRGVLADEHRRGSREARFERSDAGVEVLRCPNCGAGLSVSGASSIVDCGHCHVSLRIAPESLHRLGNLEARPLVWWLLFEGPSNQRRALERKLRQAQAREARARKSAPGPAKGSPAADDAESETRAAREAPTRRGGAGAMLVAAVVTAVVGYLGFRDHVAGWLGSAHPLVRQVLPGADAETDSQSPADAPGAPGRAPGEATGDTPSALPSWAGSREAFMTLEGCECRGRLGKARVPVQLAAQARDRSRPGVAPPVIELAFHLDAGETSFPLAVDDDSAPPARVTARVLGIGVACHRDTVAIVAGERVTGWSLADGSRQWDATLAASYRHDGQPVENGIGIPCKRLRVRKGRVRVPVGRKGAMQIDMSSGRVR